MREIEGKLILKDRLLIIKVLVHLDVGERDATDLTLDDHFEATHELSIRPAVASC